MCKKKKRSKLYPQLSDFCLPHFWRKKKKGGCIKLISCLSKQTLPGLCSLWVGVATPYHSEKYLSSVASVCDVLCHFWRTHGLKPSYTEQLLQKGCTDSPQHVTSPALDSGSFLVEFSGLPPQLENKASVTLSSCNTVPPTIFIKCFKWKTTT